MNHDSFFADLDQQAAGSGIDRPIFYVIFLKIRPNCLMYVLGLKYVVHKEMCLNDIFSVFPSKGYAEMYDTNYEGIKAFTSISCLVD